MKKFLKLCMAVAALATMFGFASCSNGSDDTTVAAAATTTTTTSAATTAETPATTTAAANAFAGKTFVSDEGKVIFVFGSNGKVIFAQDKEKIFTETYTVTGNDFTFTVAGQNKISGSLSGTALTAGDAAHGKGTFAQTSGTNGFAGKSFMTSDSKIIVFVSDSKVVLGGDKGNFHSINYTVSGGKATAEGFEATISGKTLTVKTTVHGEDHTDTGNLIE